MVQEQLGLALNRAGRGDEAEKVLLDVLARRGPTVTLMELRDPPDARRNDLLPVVSYAVKLRIEAGKPDYWDHATRLELAVLRRDQEEATAAAGDALAAVRESWEPETTARNLRLICEARDRRGETVAWALEIEQALVARAGFS